VSWGYSFPAFSFHSILFNPDFACWSIEF
jgi:hypothetical protein